MPPKFPQGLDRYKHRAKRLVLVRLTHFNAHYGFSWERVSIRDQRSRWGSCSTNGTLCFNWRVAILPPELADYIILHELCHLGSFDHSDTFWRLVEKVMPNHHEHRRALRVLEREYFYEQIAKGIRQPA